MNKENSMNNEYINAPETGHSPEVQAAWHAGIEAGREIERQNAAAQEPVAWAAVHFGGRRDGKIYTTCDTREQIEAYIQDVHQSSDSLTLRARPLAFADAPVAAQAQPDYPGATVADRLDAMADDCAPGSQRAADLRAAATVWRKHLAGPAAQPKRRPYNASGSLSEYGIFPECDAAPVAAQAPAANYRRVSYVCPVCAASLERQE